MARDHSLSRWLRGVGGEKHAPATTSARPAIEVLEDRRLLSATLVNPGGSLLVAPTPTPVNVPAKGYGVTLNLKAGQAFSGYLGDLVGAKVPAGFVVSASLNWGDGTAIAKGKVTITSSGHIDVSGSHTYIKAGKFAISIGVTATPGPSGAVAAPIILYLGTIHSTAAVTTSGGVILKEKAGVPFTATVGTFSYIAPATGLAASINWGDGTDSSAGTITSTGVSGVDVINFKVTGSHTYAKPGTYPITVTVTQHLGPPGSLAPVRLITTIDSTAIVTAAGLNLDGTIAGTFVPAPTAASIGALYIFNGATGAAGAMGPVSANGRIQLPPFMTTGPVTGGMTLTTISATPGGPSGSVTLALTGPVEASSGPIPATLTYVITSGTGSFANATGSGTIEVTLGSTGLAFTMVIHSN
jgi:hypothetical protein